MQFDFDAYEKEHPRPEYANVYRQLETDPSIRELPAHVITVLEYAGRRMQALGKTEEDVAHMTGIDLADVVCWWDGRAYGEGAGNFNAMVGRRFQHQMQKWYHALHCAMMEPYGYTADDGGVDVGYLADILDHWLNPSLNGWDTLDEYTRRRKAAEMLQSALFCYYKAREYHER